MKSFKHDRTMTYLDISQPLRKLEDHPTLQLNRPQEMRPDILEAFEQGAKEIKVITEDHRSYVPRVISIADSRLVLRFPDSLKVYLTPYVLLVFSGEDFEYVVQGFVRRFFFPMVTISYADPRLQKRWKLNLKESITCYTVSNSLLEQLMVDELELVRCSSVMHPDKASERGEVSQKVLVIEDHLCCSVSFESDRDEEMVSEEGYDSKQDLLVTDFEEDFEAQEELERKKVVGNLSDISSSGIGLLSLKGCEVAQPGSLVYMQLPLMRYQESRVSLVKFRISLFGIVRYQRPVLEDGFVLSGIQFIRSIDDLRFFELLKTEGYLASP